jgi:Flp pilus assembly protein TadD
VEGKVGIYPFNKSGAVLCKKEQHELPPRADSSYVDIIGVLLRSENVDAVELDGNCQSTDIGSSSFQSLLDTLRFALDGNIDDIETHELLYIIALETSDVRFGLEACEKAIRLFSNNAYYYIQQADLLLQAGEDDKANSAYLKAIELDCSIPEPHFRLSRIHGRRGDMEQAIQRIRDAIAAKDNNPHFYHHLGNLLMNIDDLEGARKAQEKAITLDPSNPGPHIQLSRICHQLGDTAQAILKARDAIGAKDDEPSSYHHLGMLLKRNGDFAGAREALEKAMLMRTSRSEHPAEEGPCASFSADIRSAKADRASAHGLARP